MRTIVLFFAFLSLGFILQDSGETVIFKHPDYVLKKYVIRTREFSTTLFVVIIEPKHVKAKIQGLTQRHSNGRTAVEVVRTGAKVVLGGGFVSSFYPLIPNGFLKIDGATISALRAGGYNGVAGVNGGKLSLLRCSNESIDKVYEGFQTGPFLVQGGSVVFRPSSEASYRAYNRAIVAINTNNKVVVAVTTEPVTLLQLATFLSGTSNTDLKSKEVLNLAGGGSETLVVKGNNTVYTYGSFQDNQSALIAFY